MYYKSLAVMNFKELVRREPAYFIFFLVFIAREVILYSMGIVIAVNYNAMHIPDTFELVSNPFSALFYFHAQPPLLGLVFLAALKSGFPQTFLNISYSVLCLAMCLILLRMMNIFKAGRWFSLAAVTFFSITPPVIILQHFSNHTFIEAFLITAFSWSILEWLSDYRKVFLYLGFFFLMLLTLLRPYFHPFLFLPVILIMVLFKSGQRKEILKAGLSFSIIPLALILKNLILFGIISTSSWTGLNLSRPIQYALGEDLLNELIKADKLPFYANREYFFFKPQDIIDSLAMPKTGIPILDNKYRKSGWINYNNAALIKASKTLLKADLYVIRKYPSKILKSFFLGLYYYFMPARTFARWALPNEDKLGSWNIFYWKYLCLEKNFCRYRGLERVDYVIYISIIMIYLLFFAVSLFKIAKRDKRTLFWLFVSSTVLYHIIFTNIFELGENTRFRFATEPIVFLVFAIFLFRMQDYIKRKLLRS